MAENNIGSSRLLGTNGAQRAVDSLETQVNTLARSIASAVRAFQSLSTTTTRTSSRAANSNWNLNSNFPTSVGGIFRNATGPQFSQTGTQSRSGNGGNGGFSAPTPMSGARGNGGVGVPVSPTMGAFAAGGAVVAGAARGMINYGNRNMSTNMMMDLYGSYAALSGGIPNGGFQNANNRARHATFTNNNIGLGAEDVARGGFTAMYTFGSAQRMGSVNPAFAQGTAQASGFAYASPTAGFAGAMTAAQETYAPRSVMMAQALGLSSPILNGGQKNSMGNVANSMLARVFQGRTQVSVGELSASLQQGGSMATSLSYMSRQMGWSENTRQVYENYLRGVTAAQANGMSQREYDRLTTQAATGSGATKEKAVSALTKATGMGASMFERQRDLNATRLSRQDAILDSLAPAFEEATDVVNDFSAALTSFLKETGLDKLIGTGAGWGSAISGALGGFSGGFGAVGGMMMASRFMGGGGAMGGMLGGLRGAATGAAAGGAGGLGGLAPVAAGAGAAGAAGGGWMAALGPGLAVVGATVASGDANKRLNDRFQNDQYQGFMKKGWIPSTTTPDQWKLIDKAVNSRRPVPKDAKGFEKAYREESAKIVGQGGRLTGNTGQPGGADFDVVSGKKKKSNPGQAPGSNSGASAAQVIAFAQQQIGEPYVWGGVGPDGWDCSGLMQWAFGQAGVQLPRVSQQQQTVGKEVPVENAQPGDLLFWGKPAHHVALALGNGKMLEAPRTGLNVRIRSYTPGEITNVKRVLGSVGDMGSLSLDNTDDPQTLNNQGSTVGGNIGGGAYGGTSELAALMGALGGGVAAGPVGLSASKGSSATTGNNAVSDVSAGNAPSNPTGNAALGKKLAEQLYGWTGNQWDALYQLWTKESNWNHHADNPNSDAYGIPQAMSNLHKETNTSEWRNSPEAQIRWGLKYIAGKYKTPEAAWSFWNSQNPHWYDKGAWNLEQDTTARVHKGEMILPARQAESVREAITNTLTTGTSTSGTGSIVFESGSIVINPKGPMSQQEALMTGKMIVDAITEDNRIKALQMGK